jgi:PAS domain S-box-containing protein
MLALNSARELPELLSVVLKHFTELLAGDDGAIFLVDSDGRRLGGITLEQANRGQVPIAGPDDAAAWFVRLGSSASLVIPLVVDRRCLGLLYVNFRDRNAWPAQEDVEFGKALAAQAALALDRCLAEEQRLRRLQREQERVRQDGGPLGVLTSESPIEDGQAGALALVTDITTASTVEPGSTPNADDLSRVLPSVVDGVVVTDGSGRVLWINPMAERLTGWSLAAARGRPFAEVFELVDSESRQRQESPVADVLGGGAASAMAAPMTLVARDGTECSVVHSVAPIEDGPGVTEGAVVLLRALTDP